MGRPRLTPEQQEASFQRRLKLSREHDRIRDRRRNQMPDRIAAKREHMKRYNQRPEVIRHRRWYYDNVALPRMCGIET